MKLKTSVMIPMSRNACLMDEKELCESDLGVRSQSVNLTATHFVIKENIVGTVGTFKIFLPTGTVVLQFRTVLGQVPTPCGLSHSFQLFKDLQAVTKV